jgi:hypothetical protein
MALMDAVASAGVSARLDGLPLWIMVVAGSAAGKTETVQSLTGAGAVAVSTLSSEAAVLAQIRPGGTGGLLREAVAAGGIAVVRDFGSILSMDRHLRPRILQMLRQAFDGHVDRHIGSDGAKVLRWDGRIVFVAASMPIWDTAHEVISAMGDRFVVVRGDTALDRKAVGRQALGNTGKEATMERELATAMGALVASADVNVRALTPAEEEKLIDIADVVTLARTAVERDFRGDVVSPYDAEANTRFGKQLAQAVRGGLAFGLDQDDAMARAARYARDTIPPSRWRMLLHLADSQWVEPNSICLSFKRSLAAIKNDLEVLRMLGLADAYDNEERRGGRIAMFRYYSLSATVDRRTIKVLRGV